MALFQSVLCGVDFSENSANALVAAHVFAEAHGASLVAITVVDPLLLQAAAIAETVETVAAATMDDLAEFATATLGTSAAATVEKHVATGRPAREILRAAETWRADVIVVGTHGLGGIRKLVFGSTTDRILRDTGTAVLAVPSGHEPALSGMRTVLACLPVDRSIDLLLANAAGAAAPFGAELVVVHVLEPPQLPPRIRSTRTLTELRDRAMTVLDAAVSATRLPPVRRLIPEGAVEAEVPRVAREEQAGLVIVGLGRTDSPEGKPGTTAYRIVRASPVPVLALPERTG